jgi:hydrogenase expression/formation protein HypC
MCLAIPMQIESIDGFVAHCQAKGIWRDVSLFMMQDELPGVGDYVMVHVGYAIQKMTEADARSSWELFDQILEETGEPGCVTP